MTEQPPYRRSDGDVTLLGCLCVMAGAAIGWFLVWFVVLGLLLVLLPKPPDADKTTQEAPGVIAGLVGLGGAYAGAYASVRAEKAIRRMLGRREDQG